MGRGGVAEAGVMFALLAVLLATPAEPGCGPANPSLNGEGVGALRIGAPVEEVDRRCRVLSDKIVPGGEDIPTRMLRVKFAEAVVEAVIDEGKVWSVKIDTSSLRTDTGLGVGTSISDLLRQPDLTGDVGEGDLYVFTSRHCGVSFKLSYTPSEADDNEAWTTAHLSRLPRATKVVQVLLTGCGKL
jgi:hypothetical protein